MDSNSDKKNNYEDQDPILKGYNKEKALEEVEMLGNILMQSLQHFFVISSGLEHFSLTGKAAFLYTLRNSIGSFVNETVNVGVLTANIPKVSTLGVEKPNLGEKNIPELKEPTAEEMAKIEHEWKTLSNK